MPNKVKFMALVDDITGEARTIGAINTVFSRLDAHGKRRKIGTNTDCVGICETLRSRYASTDEITTTTGRPGLVVGAEAPLVVQSTLWTWLKPSEIYVVNRLKAEVQGLLSDFEKSMPGIKLRHVETLEQARSIPTPRVITGTVPSAHPKGPGEVLAWDICHAFRNRSGTIGTVLDMCYPPVRTRLLKVAERYGWKIMVGTEVLVQVAAAQNALWVEKVPPAAAVEEAVMALQARTKL
ncbi:uncharacterized protein A1O9_01533 [Exophiala aquamarina CBS 119918]|uniref:Uncharacterized protein n=1 Tax=Exophiala aquamarina CBS 119918 TaxID=1182545 RepID=A0A072Q6J8_9EURO|nr:uncharacterized protein A1O9_01533 [Exophiala aquamarina CBS 119918]KEF63555.1 hypothetical protein A1O9_01533 [Exophiala aquamarina CBS 119918]